VRFSCTTPCNGRFLIQPSADQCSDYPMRDALRLSQIDSQRRSPRANGQHWVNFQHLPAHMPRNRTIPRHEEAGILLEQSMKHAVEMPFVPLEVEFK
jgi:hypothetical protein